MSVWQKVKCFFTGKKQFGGIKERDEGGKKEPLRAIRERRKDISHAIGTGLLIFIALVMVSEMSLALINFFFWQNKNVGAFVIPIAVMPAVAVILTGIVIYVGNQANKMKVKFISAFDRLSRGEFGCRLEVPAKGQFKSLFENFNKMSKELSSIQALKDEFIHDFSHEFKTPIASINGFANLLLDGDVTEEERRRYLKIIADESARLSTLAENTLMLNRLENQQFVGETQPYRLDTQIKDCIILLEGEWSKKNIAVNSSLERVEYCGNAAMIRQVWVNLLTNAVKFTPENGEICVTLRAGENFAEVCVSDSGVGMSEEVAAHAFDRYYRGDSSRSSGGNGLGLSIVKRIVALCGGSVSVSSRPGEGSAFTVRLPLDAG